MKWSQASRIKVKERTEEWEWERKRAEDEISARCSKKPKLKRQTADWMNKRMLYTQTHTHTYTYKHNSALNKINYFLEMESTETKQ